MKVPVRGLVALLLVAAMLWMPLLQGRALAASQAAQPASTQLPLRDYLRDSYVELFKISPRLTFSASTFSEVSNDLKQGQSECDSTFKQRSSELGKELSQSQEQLGKETYSITAAERHHVHCSIQNMRAEQAQAEVLAQHAIPIAYQNLEAKLELIQQWPGDLQQIRQEIADGSYKNRRWEDVQDIGFRTIAAGQAKDIKLGVQAVKEMKDSGLMPPVVKDKEIVNYVTNVAKKVGAHSDLKVPLHVTVLDDKTINAFSLPGGYVFVERGLLDATDNEAELAGVLGHEIGHICARHGHKLMTRSTIAGILYQAAAVAGMVFTGGIFNIGTYYALEYGYEGLGMLLELSLLGVSREYELQADQLGIEYAWNSGYDPSGFIRFFDKMATKVGYVNSLDWFYDHPPFYERMVDAERQIMFLPKKSTYIVNTPQFKQMKKELAKMEAKEKKKTEAAGGWNSKLHLFVHEKGCQAPHEIKYKPGESIVKVCSEPLD